MTKEMSDAPTLKPFPERQLPKSSSELLLLTVVTLACLCPFLGKAFHIDDPLFIWSGRHILSEPWNFYNFTLNWSGYGLPMSAVTQNPPLTSYYLALIGSLFGWSEMALHAGFLLPALALVAGTYRLARKLCAHPLAAALTTVTAPVFLLCSTSVMCDTMMVAFWVWSLVLWMEGLAENRPAKLWISAFLIAACGLTKYFGFALIPLALAYSLMERRKIGPWLAYLLIPVIILAGYEWLTHKLYGRGSLFDGLVYAENQHTGANLGLKTLVGLAFCGGLMIILLPSAPLLWGKRALAAGIAGLVLFGAFVVTIKHVEQVPTVENGRVNWPFVAQISLFVAAGASLAVLAVADVFRHRTPAATVLFLWIAGTYVFTCFDCWQISGRYLLPMLPAVSILLIRRLELRRSLHDGNRIGPLLGPLAISLAIALMAAWADFKLANSARIAATRIPREVGVATHAVWFEGHWGFQYYMEQQGARPVDFMNLRFASNDVIILPLENSCVFNLSQTNLETSYEHDFSSSKWLATMDRTSGAGFHSDVWGPLPFAFCQVPLEQYVIMRAK
jgi:4-amino-4-deoxy-L-arabinose transferase-like glycosyltransferase